MRRAAVASAVVVLVLGALFIVRPFAATQRDAAAEIVSPASLAQTDVVELRRGHPVCFDRAVIEQHSELIRFKVSSPNGPAPEIDVHIKGGVYDYTAKVPPGTQDGTLLAMPVPAAPTDIPVRVCLRNRGEPAIGLFASNDRTRSRSVATIDGESTGKSVWFGFYELTPKAITERLSATIARMTVFRPGYVTAGVLWGLLVLLVAGVPIGVVWAYQRALREDERATPDELDVNQRRTRWRRFVG
jgi:hypothetical protein